MSKATVVFLNRVGYNLEIHYVVNGDWSVLCDSKGIIQLVVDGRATRLERFNSINLIDTHFVGKHKDSI